MINKADQAYIRVVEQCPWLLKLPVTIEDLRILIPVAYMIGTVDGATDMRDSMDKALKGLS